ncbi:bifunctional diguanylate cyclase/phosphodiesterase [Bacterioplanoides pacificum]|uniref:EAL domain-containing protein n=1 Tax=Bacterioplanoides pacificum TaxID=1171596 RepID=A0ABV7VVE8_9GAMM
MSASEAEYNPNNAVVSLSRYSHLLELMVSGTSLPQLLNELCYLIQDKKPDCLASVLLLSDDGKRLTHGAAPSLPQAYIDGINGVEIGDGVGSCGTAAFSGKLVIVEDIDNHPYWQPYKELAATGMLKACWSQPILGNDNQVLGTFAMYYQHPQAPDADDILLILEAARLARFGIEHHKAQLHARLSGLIAQHLPMGMMITDEQFNITDVNPAFTQMTGYSHADIAGKTPRMLANDSHQLEHYKDILQQLPSSRSWTSEVSARRKNQEVFTAEICFSVIRDEQGNIRQAVILINDISERKRSEETIQYLANYDVLTNLPNRNLCYERMTRAIEECRRQQQPFNVLILDLDYFKEINDNHGHDAGDELLVQTASRLQRCFGSSNTIARLGGDEFAVLITRPQDLARLELLLQDCLQLIAQPYRLRQVKDCRISSSIGIARFPNDGQTIEQLMKAADQAVYAAKDSGRNTYASFTPQMQQHAQTQALLHQELRHAAAEDQLELHYQPILDLRTNRVIQLEALVRWNHPQRGMIRPDLFIALAEKTGIIREIGYWVRQAALQQIKRFLAHGIRMPIAVNLSTAEFFDNELARHIIEQVDASGADPELLVIEITESLFIQNQADTRHFLDQLKEKNIRVALDDFGTGFSSLSYLSAFPVDKLKIDKSFIDRMCGDPRKQALVDSIINLGHALGMRVIAEGVEEQQQKDELARKGCDCIQGYLLSRPLNQAAIEDFLQQH